MPSTSWLAPLSLMVAATVWGLVWYPYRLLEQAGLSGCLASLITYLAAALPLLPVVRRGWRLPPAQRGWMLAVALTAGWTNLSYVLAVIHGEVIRVLLLFYLAPLWTLLFARFFLHERAGRLGLAIIGLSLAGAIVMLQRGTGLPLPASPAEWMGLGSGIGFALSNVLTRKVCETPIAIRSLWVFLGVVGISLLSVSANGEAFGALARLDMPHWLMVAGVALTLVLATFAVQYGLAHTPANQAIVILLSELVVAAVSSQLLAGEVMEMREWIGGAMIVAATLFSGRMSHA